MFLHKDYPYSMFIVQVDTLDELNFTLDYIKKYGFTLPNLAVKEMFEKINSEPIYIRLGIFDDFGWSNMGFFNNEDFPYTKGKDFEELFKVRDLKNDLLGYITRYGKYIGIPKYNPKQKIDRIIESTDSSSDIYIYLTDREHSTNIQERLIRMGFKWCDGLAEVYHPISRTNVYDIVLDVDLIKKDMSFFDGIDEYKKMISSDVKLYTYDEVEDFIRNIKKPDYNPRIKSERVLEKFFNDKYRYNAIPIRVDTVVDLDRVINFIKSNIEIPFDFNIDELNLIIKNNYLYRHKTAIFEFYIQISGKLNFGWDDIDDYLRYTNRNLYEKIFTTEDLENGLIDKIMTYGNSNPIPSYAPKKKIVRESSELNCRVVILATNNEESTKIQEEIFKAGYKWAGSMEGIHSFDFEMYSKIVLYANLTTNKITWDEPWGNYINDIEKGYWSDVYPKVFTFKELNNYIHFIKTRREAPKYEPRKRIERIIESLNDVKQLQNYKHVAIIADSVSENINIQKELFKIGYGWCLRGREYDILNRGAENLLFLVSVDDKVIYTLSHVSDFELHMDSFKICPHLFKYNELDTFLNYLKNGSIVPSYKPKQKIVRESVTIYEKALIYIQNDDESKIVQNKLFENGFKWGGYFSSNFVNKQTPYILVSYFDNKILKYIDGDNTIFIDEARKGIYQGAYPKLYYINTLDEYIRLVNNKEIIPSYKPKGKIIRESINHRDIKNRENYDYVCILVKSKNIKEFQEMMFDNGYFWAGDVERFNDVKHTDKQHVIFCVYKNNDIYSLGRGNESMDDFERGISNHNLCPYLFSFNEIYMFMFYLKFGIITPSYKPKGKIVRENKIFEEVADNIQLDNGDVLNYYDDDAYAFLFLYGYPDGIFIMENGMMHKNMIGDYLYKKNDPEYAEVYHTEDFDDFLYNKVDESEYKGRLWVNNKVISFWDLSCNEQDKSALKDIIKRIENKLNVKITNEWMIEFFDIEKQRLFFITIDKYFKGELDEEDSKKMSTSYYEYLKQKHLDTTYKKPVPFGYGSKNPKYKPLELRQALYQESFNGEFMNVNNMPTVSRELTPLEQKEHFKRGDIVYIRPDAENYFNDMDDSSKKFIGQTAKILDVLSYRHVYSDKNNKRYSIENIIVNNVIPSGIKHRWNDLIVFVANDSIDDEFDYGFFYRCLYKPSLAEPVYRGKDKIVRETQENNSINESGEWYPYRFKTQQEFIDEFGQDWIQFIKFGWDDDGYMDYLFGKDYPFFINKDIDKLPTLQSEYDSDIDFLISWDMLTPNPKIEPDYKPKSRIERKVLESLDNKYSGVVFTVNSIEENKILQNGLFSMGYMWASIGQSVKYFPDYPMYIFINSKNKNLSHLYHGDLLHSNADISSYIKYNNSTYGDNLCLTSFGYKDYKYIDTILKYGHIGPSYEPKSKIVRESLEIDFSQLPYDSFCFKTENNNLDNIKLYLKSIGIEWYIIEQNREYVFFTRKLTSHEPFRLYACDYKYFKGNQYSRAEKLKLSPLFSFNELKDYIRSFNKPTYKPKGKINRDIITEDCDFVNLPDGKRLSFNDGDAVAFMYINNKFLFGKPTERHYDIVFKYLISINVYSEDRAKDIYFDSPIKGRIWLNSKVISFWDYIKKDDLVRVISDIKENMNINIDDTWLIDYYDNNDDDKKNLIPIKDYLASDYIDNTSDVEYQRRKEQHIDTSFKHFVPKGYGSKSTKYKPLEYRQMLYQESANHFRKWDIKKIYNIDAVIIKGGKDISGKEKLIEYVNKSNLFKIDDSILKSMYYDVDSYVIIFKKSEKLEGVKTFTLYPASMDPDFINGRLQNGVNDIIFSDVLTINDAIKLLKGIENRKIIRKFAKIDISSMYRAKTKIVRESMINERIDAKKMDIPDDILLFYHIFKSKGHKLYLVGGCVRDYLMGIKPHDFDMVTDAQPNEVTEMLKDFRTDIHGAHFGVVRVYTENEPLGYEIATYRKDISKGRNTKGDDQKVEIGKHITIKDDVKRRDLTINALFYDIGTGEIVDIVGGRRDIESKIVRAVGEPQQRFNEDRLRILRTIRFAAVTGSKIDSETSKAIKKDNRLFGISEEDDVSRERIFAEFLKVKEKTRSNDDPSILTRFINLLIDYDIMEQIFPVLVTEKDIVPTKYLTIALAQTLRNNVIDEKFRQTLIDAKIPIKYVDIISILIRILKDGVNENNVYNLYREIKAKDVRNDILSDWIRVMRINDDNVRALLVYEPTTTGAEVMKDGFKKAEIGEEIRRRESIKFKKLVDSLK